MSDLSALVLGLGLGLRHATDADHVAVVSTMIQRERGAFRAARVAAYWGIGHSASFLAVGLLIVGAGVRPPAGFEPAVELIVAAMLVALGASHLIRHPAELPRAVSATRPVAFGLVHGLAGSAGIAVLACTSQRSAFAAALYLVLFGVGTVLGMALLTMVLSWPIAWTTRSKARWSRWIMRAPGLLSVALGVMLGLEGLGIAA